MVFGEQFHIEIRKPSDPWDTTVNVDKWFSDVEILLRKVGSTVSGKALLQAVLDSKFWVAIEPLNWNECNAHGGATKHIRNNRTFGGIVKFDPMVFAKGSSCYKSRLGGKYSHGGLADEVLFHEMIHALRGSVVHDKTPLGGGLWRYADTEEFFAVVLTNIYISEKGKDGSGLRGGERGKIPLEPYFANSLCFFASSTQILPLLREFKTKHEKLFADLAKVKSAFNPIKAMVDHPKTVEQITNAAATIANERGAEKHQKWLDQKRVTEVKATSSAMAAQEQKAIEETLKSIANATPQQMANKLGSLGSEAFDIAQKLGRSAGLGAFAGSK